MENERKQKIAKIVLWTILSAVILLIITLLLWNRFKPQVRQGNFQDFVNDIVAASKSVDDNTYLAEVKIDGVQDIAKYTFVENGIAKLREVRLGKGIVEKTFILPDKFTIGDKTYSIADLLKHPGADANVLSTQWSTVGLVLEKPNTFARIALSVLPTLLWIIILFWLYRSMMKRSMNMIGAIGDEKNPAQKIKSDKTFKDVAGNKEAVEEIKEIVDYLKNPKKYEIAGARMPHGILLGGPPGTGKTLLAKATAGEANVPFYFISASNFVEMFVGLGAKRVRTVVDEARKNAPAIIFIDELDAIGRTRGSGIGGGHDEREQTLNQLLVEMDGMKDNNGILFFAATNRTDVLDPALTRPGRFDRTITVGLPDVKEREEILNLHAKGKRVSPNVNLAQVAKRTPGYSGAQLENVINEAGLLAVRRDSEIIERDDIDEAIDRVMAGPAKKNRVITKSELTMVAYHEAGHAVVGIKMPGANKVQKITIIPRGQAGGYNLMTPEEEKYNLTKKELIAMITSFMGGRAAEEIIYGKENVSTGASDDLHKATKIARKMVTEWGMSDLGPIQYEQDDGSPFLGRDYLKSAQFSAQVAHEIDIEVRNIITEAEKKAKEIIEENRELHELIKTALLEKETIVAEEIEYIAKNMKLPSESKEEKAENVNLTIDDILDGKSEEKGETM
ncbi:ATP-dependent zinc metalloprotease FtsH [Mycoplasmopsis agalactiae]|uniref:ATP-dependent zinc metalloprotease FtsH n=1 Tax=Mycoplasmopsis agalactiae TaxID=2110 RepID=UPI000C6FE5FC|nr:ATP-dependent zinc metalloprotease FtsH [Mycoplasmopsis agalactiae]MCE6057465.1 ATP-dependent zinc metalloprotease FtsH [Mycoplasmopsis agalactiae]MCE6079241.1 ATP-dependent zinc metalloprotease FtsH [Mycoplasmopsis agalactiae]MCE6095634.1 ATP-dependent zinc metalloprotease FtsH [Mycoplasmopsis agalactiae]MCE6114879.1 ATP-dependent zinc metalloprotease FtsH [Mycoplasmopsis agalactiae]NLS34602.1 ATP-dependent zinc metalloprotease FtsH [Mycoplasmopsis agalactiae]